ncbi:hypothetical protein [Chromobacterium sphagni]|uniref:Uncharacterized protein n=1 Tax=Chromobacterium sphagni TaxID=1903179 RepID=A0ABX3CBU7_9NEIS|nr:hypothetical protein [Chromobacterium sphagni]OHX19633.1 hypothetical protein BI344_17295 [Chromobacterium sphagni]
MHEEHNISISSVSNSNSWISQLSQLNSTSLSGSADGVGMPPPPPGPPPGGGLMSAIGQPLEQIGVGSSSDTSSSSASTASSSDSADDSALSTSSSQDPQQALAAFMQNLMAALQQSFQSLVPALGGSSSGNATLRGFLQALENTVPGGSSSTGNVVSASA